MHVHVCMYNDVTYLDVADSDIEIRKLEHKLSEYRSIIGQQEQMLLQV